MKSRAGWITNWNQGCWEKYQQSHICRGFPGSSDSRECTCNVEDLGLIPGLGRSRGEGEGYPLQCSGLESSMDCSLPGFSIHGIFQARVLEWVAISFSRGSSQPRNQTWVSCIAGRHFTLWATREALRIPLKAYFKSYELFPRSSQPDTNSNYWP